MALAVGADLCDERVKLTCGPQIGHPLAAVGSEPAPIGRRRRNLGRRRSSRRHGQPFRSSLRSLFPHAIGQQGLGMPGESSLGTLLPEARVGVGRGFFGGMLLDPACCATALD